MGTDLRLMPLPRNCVITNLHRHQLHSNTTTMAVSVLGMGAVAVEFNNTKSNTEDQQLPTESKCAITSERLTYLKRLVDDAIRDHRIFTIKGGWQTLRRCFLKRNWVEKYELAKAIKPGSAVSPPNCLDDLCSNLPTRQSWESPSAHIAKCERTIMSRLLQFHDVDFYWNTRKDQHDTHLRLNCHKLINRFSRSLFTSKEGLCLLLQQMYWHNEPGIAQVNFPRCYVLGFPDHYNNFVEDFRITACTSLLKFIVHKYETEDKYVIQSPEGQIPYGSFKFAIARLNDYIDFRKHLDIDRESTPVLDEQWDQFLKHFKLIIHENNLFLESKDYNLDELIAASKSILKKMIPFWPQLDLDGMKNIWIMKPGNKCRGRGIQLIKDVKDVAKMMDMKLKYVVQKYIEKPLIIYETKFDIRQWFLITSVQPLMIWMYRESYLRFSSQNFSLENFHESLHLTNHAVQCKYKNKQDRNKALPDENMWDCHTFKTYLSGIGHENKWDAVIFPGMKESIIGSMLACQETMDRRPNTFELYGADFILAEDFKPWLLEINSSPDLSSSTSITAKMCPQCLEDIVKVVIDKRRDPNCETGLFELIYKQNLPRAPAYLGMSLTVRGRKVFKRKTIRKDNESNKTKSNRSAKLSPPDMALTLPEPVMKEVVKKYTGPVIEDLMVELKRHAGQESDCEAGFEVAIPVKIERKKPANKSDSRVPRYQTIPPIEINESNSIRPKGNVRENYKTAQTVSSKMVRNNCSVSRRELSFDPKPHQDFWIDNMEKIGEPNSYKSENVQVLKVHSPKGVKSGEKTKRSQKENVIIEIKGKTKQDNNIDPMKTRYSADAQANTRRRNQFKQKHKNDNIISKKLNSNAPVLKLMEIKAVDTTKDPKKNPLPPKSKPATPKPSVTPDIKPKTPLDKDIFTSKLTNILEKLHKDYNAIESAIPKPAIAGARTVGKPGTDKTLAYIQEWSNKSNAILKEKLIEMIQNQRTNMRNFSKSNPATTKTSSISNKSTKNAATKTKITPSMNSTCKKTINTSNVDGWQKHATNQLNFGKPSNLTPQYYNPSRSCPMHTIVINKPLVQSQTTSMHVNNLPATAKSASITMAKSTSMNLRKPSPVPGIAHGATKDEVQMIRERVDEAIKQRKTFSICGNYYSIRHALTSRGWIEKINNAFTPNNCDNALVRRLQLLSVPELAVGLKDKEFGHVYRQVIQSKFIGNTPLALYWDLNRETFRNNSEHVKNALVNFISKNRFNYANKQGLCECIKNAYWYNNPGISYLRVPRSYCLINNGDPDEFIEDFKVTAAMSFLKWIVYTHDSKKSKLISNCGKIPIRYFHFALQECAKFAQKLRHEDIDKDIRPAIPHEWQEFLDSFYKVVHVGNHFQDTSLETELSLVHKSKTMLNKLRKMWPCVDMDGFMNIWILKPSYGSRGVGIYFCRTLQYVLKVLKEHKNNSYVIQKYIERPLLIHHTKFDIRQWFLISSTMPLTIWIYKECYLRFSSQTYNLRKLHESIHLTNNSVQSKYHNGNRDPGLPVHNMWFLREFKEHLTNLGYPHVYDDIIFPGIKECITAAVLATQDQIYRTTKAFELHGADFMITEDFMPWLIEINSKPALNPSTAVTSKLCPAVLEDVIKVVVDHARNPKAPTGNFELLYKEKVMTLPPVDDSTLQIKGQPIDANYFLTPEQEENVPVNMTADRSGDSINIIKTTDYMKYIGKEMKNTLKQLLALVEKEKERRRRLREPNAAGEMDMESFECCEDMEKIKRNMKEIQEIFKFNERGGKKGSVDQICLPKASESLLRTNSNKIKQAIGSLENKSKEKDTSTSIFSNIMNMIEAFNYPAA